MGHREGPGPGVSPDVSPARGTNALSDLGQATAHLTWSYHLQSRVTKPAGVLVENSNPRTDSARAGLQGLPPACQELDLSARPQLPHPTRGWTQTLYFPQESSSQGCLILLTFLIKKLTIDKPNYPQQRVHRSRHMGPGWGNSAQ